MVEDMKMSQSASDVIAERLFEAGCRRAFGIPGGEVLSLMDAHTYTHQVLNHVKLREPATRAQS
ncbi:hypothetical protein [Ruegeria sp.]|uniref:hypothetical protein n=1 Tax=Ruegeria sp. TaxID=1879320 RepID=UPI002316DC00|nr:hypothetical protein [Ruegeria sp.]MDA7965343.1 hypothetical protein [Ruegeria sp.]